MARNNTWHTAPLLPKLLKRCGTCLQHKDKLGRLFNLLVSSLERFLQPQYKCSLPARLNFLIEENKICREELCSSVLLHWDDGCFEASVCHWSRYRPSTCHHRSWFASCVDAAKRWLICTLYIIPIWHMYMGICAWGRCSWWSLANFSTHAAAKTYVE